jgi:lysophospholipase L1-like esterase
MVIAFAALALLVVAAVSSTQADIAAVIAVATLMGVTSTSQSKPAFPAPGTVDFVILGDSYISGEGAQIYYTEPQRDDEPHNNCHRAPTSWAALAAQRHYKSAAFLACSGARTFNVRRTPARAKPSRQYNEPGTQLDQVQTLKAKPLDRLTPSQVVISLGGNDVGFATIGMMCLAPGNCDELLDEWMSSLPELEATLRATYAEVRDEFKHAPILVVPYPVPVHADQAGKAVTCDEVALSQGDMRFIQAFLPALNATVKRAAVAEGLDVLEGMETAFADAHLQLCDPGNDKRPGLNFIGLRSVGGVAEQRFNPANWYHNSLHPNERGHAAMVRAFEAWLAAGEDPPDAELVAQPATEPKCDLVESHSKRKLCTDVGLAWALGQVRNTLLWPWLELIAMATLGAWLLGVGLFGWRRPWWDRTGLAAVTPLPAAARTRSDGR